MSSLYSSQIQSVLDQLHTSASGDAERWQARTGTEATGSNAAGGGELIRLGEFYLAVSPEEGRFLYMLARLSKARRIVEFGASFGISSVYLGAAARDNGGSLTTTEVHPDKCASLRKTFEEAGLTDTITLLEGDAFQTLADIDGPVDMVFLDGWKSAYLPIFNLLRPKFAEGALILADNCFHEGAKDYLETVQAPQSGYLTDIKDDLAVTYVLP